MLIKIKLSMRKSPGIIWDFFVDNHSVFIFIIFEYQNKIIYQ